MLDHVFTDAIGALRDALEAAMLERMTAEERFQVDVLLGDTTWETSYGLPGEGTPPRVRADITLDWPTWSQSAFRSWLRREEPDEDPRIDVSIVLRLQRLAELPTPEKVTAVLPAPRPSLGPAPPPPPPPPGATASHTPGPPAGAPRPGCAPTSRSTGRRGRSRPSAAGCAGRSPTRTPAST